MKRFATRGKRRKKCPLCGGEIIVSELCQYTHDYKLTKSGRLSKKYTVSDNGPDDAVVAGCECGAYWEIGQFDITREGYFIDYKYSEGALDDG
ncbi:MAG: hypothetical protein K2O18_17425 [Oscillospiraceae bacterium]|nr:hypothetical protein [Oscillospiraceae bacterium]